MNFLALRVDETSSYAVGDGVRVPLAAGRFDGSRAGEAITVGVRPHDVRVVPDGGAFTLAVEVVEAMGFEAYAHGTVAGEPFIARLEATALPHTGERVSLAVDPAHVHVFDPTTGRSRATPS